MQVQADAKEGGGKGIRIRQQEKRRYFPQGSTSPSNLFSYHLLPYCMVLLTLNALLAYVFLSRNNSWRSKWQKRRLLRKEHHFNIASFSLFSFLLMAQYRLRECRSLRNKYIAEYETAVYIIGSPDDICEIQKYSNYSLKFSIYILSLTPFYSLKG